MAITINTNFQIYDDEYISNNVETLAQETRVFNELSNGAIRLVDRESAGHFQNMAFFQNMTHVGRRVTTDVAAKAATRLQMGEITSPKLARGFLVDTTRDSFRKIQRDLSLFSAVLGAQVGKQKAAGYLNTAILALRASMENVAEAQLTPAALTTDALIEGIGLMGDAGQRIVCWVMHSKHSTALARGQAAGNVESVAGRVILQDQPGSINRPIIITDSPALIDTSGTEPKYITLGLVEGAATVEESESEDVVTDTITGLGNIVERVQGEYSFNTALKGHTWLKTAGTNPDDAAIAVAANYQQAMTSVKDLTGIMITA